jgi:hypothetical protein
MKCVFLFSLQRLSKIFLVLKEFSDISSKMSKRLHVKYPLFLSDFSEIASFVDRFSKKSQVLSVIKIRPVGAELFHADRRT